MNSICKSDWFEPVPNTWSVQRMKNILTPKEGRSSDGNEELLSVTIQNGVVKRSQYLDDDDGGSRADSLVGYKIVHRDDLVNNIMKMSFRCLGVSPHDGIVSPAYSVFEINREKVDPNYLNYQLRIDRYVYEYRKLSKGIQESRMRLYDDYFLSMKVIVPSIEEQKLISSYLDKKTSQIDSLIEKIQKKIELLKEQRTSLTNHYVTKGLDPNVEMKDSGVDWIGKIPKHWKTSKIKYVSKIENGSTPKSDNPDFWNGDIRWFTPTDFKEKDGLGNLNVSSRMISQQGLDRSGCSLITKKTVLMTTRAPVGNLGIVDGTFTFNQGCKSLTPFNINLEYLYFYLLTKEEILNVFSNGTTFKELPTENLSNFKLPLPPENEQIKIVSKLLEFTTTSNKIISLLQKKIVLLKSYRQSLISSVVTGKVRVTEDMI